MAHRIEAVATRLLEISVFDNLAILNRIIPIMGTSGPNISAGRLGHSRAKYNIQNHTIGIMDTVAKTFATNRILGIINGVELAASIRTDPQTA
jgi:hypothetical protein